MKVLSRIYDLFCGIVYAFLFATVFIERDDLFNHWQWWVGIIFAVGICFTTIKWNKDEIDSLKKEINNLKENKK